MKEWFNFSFSLSPGDRPKNSTKLFQELKEAFEEQIR